MSTFATVRAERLTSELFESREPLEYLSGLTDARLYALVRTHLPDASYQELGRDNAISGLLGFHKECIRRGLARSIRGSPDLARAVFKDPLASSRIRNEFSGIPHLPEDKRHFLAPTEINKMLRREPTAHNNRQVERELADLARREIPLPLEKGQYRTSNEMVGRFRPVGGRVPVLYADPGLVPYLAERLGVAEMLPDRLKSTFVPLWMLRRFLPGGNRNSAAHNKELSDYLLDLKEHGRRKILYEAGGERLKPDNAIAIYQDAKGKDTLYADVRIVTYLEKNYLGHWPEQGSFLRGSSLCRHPRIALRDSSERVAVVNAILADLWRNYGDHFFQLDGGFNARVGDYIRRLSNGRRIGVYAEENAIGTLVTRDVVENERARMRAGGKGSQCYLQKIFKSR